MPLAITSPTTIDRNAIVAAWSHKDLALSVLSTDREIVEASEALRSLVVERALGAEPVDELYDACAMLGRLIARLRGSPTLASGTLDHAAQALGMPGAAWLPAARASVCEGFAAQVVDEARREAAQAWEFPNCAVPLGESGIAVAAGHPSEDDEALSAWSARVAKEAALAGVRRAVVSGNRRACAALLDAFALAGIEVRTPSNSHFSVR